MQVSDMTNKETEILKTKLKRSQMVSKAIWEYRGLKNKELEETAITSLNTERIRVFLDNPQLYTVLGEIYG